MITCSCTVLPDDASWLLVKRRVLYICYIYFLVDELQEQVIHLNVRVYIDTLCFSLQGTIIATGHGVG